MIELWLISQGEDPEYAPYWHGNYCGPLPVVDLDYEWCDDYMVQLDLWADNQSAPWLAKEGDK